MPDDSPTPDSPGKLPTDALKHELVELLKVVGQRAVQSLTARLGDVGKQVGGKVADQAKEVGQQVVGGEGGGGIAKLAGAGLKGGAKQVTEKVKDAVGGGGGGGKSGGGGSKVTNIVEQIDVGVPIRLAYDQWTQFTDFPGFMKKVESVEQESDTELKWRGKILWSSRDWKSTIVDQVPDQRIFWRSEGAKGYVDGTVTFHELAPNLTRILVVLEYYPNGFFEKTGNLWRAQGRRVRLELKHFRRHVMMHTVLNPEELEGWRGEIHDSEVQESTEESESAGEAGNDEADSGEAGDGEAGDGEAGDGEAPEGASQ